MAYHVGCSALWQNKQKPGRKSYSSFGDMDIGLNFKKSKSVCFQQTLLLAHLNHFKLPKRGCRHLHLQLLGHLFVLSFQDVEALQAILLGEDRRDDARDIALCFVIPRTLRPLADCSPVFPTFTTDCT